jgi:hypothetical protein
MLDLLEKSLVGLQLGVSARFYGKLENIEKFLWFQKPFVFNVFD